MQRTSNDEIENQLLRLSLTSSKGDDNRPEESFLGEENLDILQIYEKLDEATRIPENPGVILDLCLKEIVYALDAERAAIMLYDPTFGELNALATHNIDSETFFTTAAVSLTVIEWVYKEEKPLMSSDAVNDPRFSNISSVIISALRSFVCAPIMSERGLLGIIYADNRVRKRLFEERHLEFLIECSTKISGIILRFFPMIHPKPKN